MNNFKVIGIIALAAVIGFAITACDNGTTSDGGSIPQTVTYTGVSGTTAYTLKITENLSRAYSPLAGDSYQLSAGGLTSAGTVIAFTAGVFTLKPANSTEEFTATVSGNDLTNLSGTITWTVGESTAAPGVLTSGGGGGIGTLPTLGGDVGITVYAGKLIVGTTLEAFTDLITNAAGTHHYSWKKGDTPETTTMVVSTEMSYVLQPADEGKYISLTLTCSGSLGSLNIVLGPVWASDGSDKIAPALWAGNVNRTSNTAATIGFTTSEAGTAYYLVLESGADAPSPAAVKAGTSLGFVTADATSGKTVALTAGAKDIYVVVEDAAGNISTPLKIPAAAYGGGSGSDILISSVAITVTAPVGGAWLLNGVDISGTAHFTCSYVTWNPDPGILTATGGVQYTASVILTADPGYAFDTKVPTPVTINGGDASVSNISSTSITVSRPFTAIIYNPDGTWKFDIKGTPATVTITRGSIWTMNSDNSELVSSGTFTLGDNNVGALFITDVGEIGSFTITGTTTVSLWLYGTLEQYQGTYIGTKL